MTKRLAMAALIAAILAAAVVAVFHAPWYRAYFSVFGERVVPLRMVDALDHHALVVLVALLANLYFFARLLFTGLLLLVADERTRVVAWYTPRGAHLQGAVALAANVALNLLPAHHSTLLQSDVPLTRSWGGPLLVVASLAAHVVIHLIARDSQLARTQVWADADGAPLRKRSRWIRAPRQERPLVKSPPLPPLAPLGGDPFRAGPATGIAARIVQPATQVAVPRTEDKDAPDPKLLV